MPELSIDEATVTIATLADYRVALVLLDDHGYTLDAVEDWIATTTARAVLVPRGVRSGRRAARLLDSM